MATAGSDCLSIGRGIPHAVWLVALFDRGLDYARLMSRAFGPSLGRTHYYRGGGKMTKLGK